MDSISYPRRILLCVTGLTPQVVTETLYALYRTDPEQMPTEVHLVTTAHGRNRAQRDLLHIGDGKFHQFCREFHLDGQIAFPENHIHVIKGRYGEELSDIRTPAENECAADLIMNIVRTFCSDAQSQVHVSIAGGRKSMGFLVGYALSVYGREQDVLSHVLTSEPFENNKDFFYPSVSPNPIFHADGRPLDPSQADVALANIPLVKLRSGLTQEFLNSEISYSESIALAQQAIAPVISIRFDTHNRTVFLGECVLKLSPVPFAIYYWFVKLHKNGRLPGMPGEDLTLDDFMQTCKDIFSKYSSTCETIENSNKDPEFFKQYFQEKRSLINRSITTKLGHDRAQPYLIQSNKKRLNIKYFMVIAPTSVEIE